MNESHKPEQKDTLTFKDFKTDYIPVWCKGCGDFGVLASLTKACANLGLRTENTSIISGIGCSSRLPAYTKTYGFHTIHGRALPVATGLRVARPDLAIFVVSGDGDGLSIGGNHFLHACRRNVDLTMIVMDNEVYGMTKGQASPTTPCDWEKSKLTPQGTHIDPINSIALALSAGATFVARSFSNNPKQLQEIIEQAHNHKGFAFIQVLSPCVTFVPEQKNWKNIVEDSTKPMASNRYQALSMLGDLGNFETGIFLKENKHEFFEKNAKHTNPLLDQSNNNDQAIINNFLTEFEV